MSCRDRFTNSLWGFRHCLATLHTKEGQKEFLSLTATLYSETALASGLGFIAFLSMHFLGAGDIIVPLLGFGGASVISNFIAVICKHYGEKTQ